MSPRAALARANICGYFEIFCRLEDARHFYCAACRVGLPTSPGKREINIYGIAEFSLPLRLRFAVHIFADTSVSLCRRKQLCSLFRGPRVCRVRKDSCLAKLPQTARKYLTPPTSVFAECDCLGSSLNICGSSNVSNSPAETRRISFPDSLFKFFLSVSLVRHR